jgi:hypothetical protein
MQHAACTAEDCVKESGKLIQKRLTGWSIAGWTCRFLLASNSVVSLAMMIDLFAKGFA